MSPEYSGASAWPTWKARTAWLGARCLLICAHVGGAVLRHDSVKCAVIVSSITRFAMCSLVTRLDLNQGISCGNQLVYWPTQCSSGRGMQPDLIAKYALARIPRYTSYPTAPHF